MNKHHIWASAFAMLALTYGGKLLAQGRLDLAGQWEFQIDRADKGTADKWYDRPLEDRILLPGSMPQRLKGDRPSVETQWTGSLYDSSYFITLTWRNTVGKRTSSCRFPDARPPLCGDGLVPKDGGSSG